MRQSTKFISVLLLIPILAACAPPPAQESALPPAPSATPTPLPTQTPEPTATATPVPEPFRIAAGYLERWDGAAYQQMVAASSYLVDASQEWVTAFDSSGMPVAVYHAASGLVLQPGETGLISLDGVPHVWNPEKLTWEALTFNLLDGRLVRYNETSRMIEPITAVEPLNLEDKFARFAPALNQFNDGGEPQRSPEELALRRAEQYWRVYQAENGVVGFPFANQAEFIQAMEAFAQNRPELEVIQRQSPDGTKVMALIWDRSNRRIFWSQDPNTGWLAFMEPHAYGAGSVTTSIELPAGAVRPEVRYNQMNGRWFVFAVNEQGIATHVFEGHRGVTQGELRWRELFLGNFSERYPASFTDEFVFHDPESGLDIPIGIGLTGDLPVRAVYLTDLGKEYLGRSWLAACYYRYREIMGHKDVTYEQYLELVKQGQGQVEMWYHDELSGQRQIALVDPRSGISVVTTLNPNLPLRQSPSNAQYKYHKYLSMNSDGQVIVVAEYNEEALQAAYKGSVVEKHRPTSFFYANIVHSSFLGSVYYPGMLTPQNFESGGLMMKQPEGKIKEVLDFYLDPYRFITVDAFTKHPFVAEIRLK